MGGDFNDIRCLGKKRGKVRSEASCKGFVDFIQGMNMEEIDYQGRKETQTNNRQDDEYIEVRLDRFFGSAQWTIAHEKVVVKHIEKQASDHSLLLLDTKPEEGKTKRRFYFDQRWLTKVEVEEVVRNAWDPDCIGSPMFQVAYKIKWCRLELLKQSKQLQGNSAIKIQKLKEELETLREQEGQRDWEQWLMLKKQLDTTYKEDEVYWSQKVRTQWLKE